MSSSSTDVVSLTKMSSWYNLAHLADRTRLCYDAYQDYIGECWAVLDKSSFKCARKFSKLERNIHIGSLCLKDQIQMR